jgi:hypothetical protein
MNNQEHKIAKGYITGQAITYFFLSILLIRETFTLNPQVYTSETPFFYIGKLSGNIPFPMINLHIDFAYWIMFILALICLGLSIFFFITLFSQNWINKYKKIALDLSTPFSLLVLLSFVLSWANGLASVLSVVNNQIIAGIFSYSGIVVLLTLLALQIVNPIKDAKNKGSHKKEYCISKMTKDALPCL